MCEGWGAELPFGMGDIMAYLSITYHEYVSSILPSFICLTGLSVRCKVWPPSAEKLIKQGCSDRVQSHCSLQSDQRLCCK